MVRSPEVADGAAADADEGVAADAAAFREGSPVVSVAAGEDGPAAGTARADGAGGLQLAADERPDACALPVTPLFYMYLLLFLFIINSFLS